MIFDTQYWQRELIRLAEALRKHGTQKRWLRASDASVEKCVMLGFYAIRKMLPGHAFRPPPYLENKPSLRITTYSRNKVTRSTISWPDVKVAFDLKQGRRETLDIDYVCNQFIHSHFFSTWLGPNKELRGVFCCSDRSKDKEIYRFELVTIIDLFEAVGTSQHKVASLRHFAPEDNRIIM